MDRFLKLLKHMQGNTYSNTSCGSLRLVSLTELRDNSPEYYVASAGKRFSILERRCSPLYYIFVWLIARLRLVFGVSINLLLNVILIYPIHRECSIQ